ncbi:GGDEF domain-containing protein [Sphingomonas faeni]|uniref:GGDEF domain-containing protein n=1 Tax=Sphingomonas faeni TaxID=185950 RepID=UPI002789FCE1|nr:GGDEF domain-containing protein [Sphingomonas faeni]MDQ0840033.1 diguanylate cyclase (GGDEF)-like protein [Sphingomonas faeni]
MVPAEIRQSLVQGLYGSLPIFLGGVFNTILVSSIVATRIPTPAFLFWAALEIGLAALRLPLLVKGSRAAKSGKRAHIDIYILAAACWAGSVGYGCFIAVLSGDWLAATLVVLSAAAMTGGVAFRNFSAPRLVMVTIMLSLGPCAVAGVISGELIMIATALQIPMYIYAMTHAAYRLNAMLVQTMRSERENGRRARHDTLTGLLNRAGLEDVVARRTDGTQNGATLFYIDLDGFKTINDTLGHAAGDQLLVEVSKLMRNVTPSMGVVAWIGGDEFIILTDQMDPATACQTAQRFIDTLSHTPFLLSGTAVTVGASVGISMRSDPLTDLSTLMLEADKALYDAKLKGRSRADLATGALPSLYLASNQGSSVQLGKSAVR